PARAQRDRHPPVLPGGRHSGARSVDRARGDRTDAAHRSNALVNRFASYGWLRRGDVFHRVILITPPRPERAYPSFMATSVATDTRALRLLIVEDDDSSASLLRELLESSDGPSFAIRHVTSASDACEAVEAGDIDVVLLDLGLPDANDLEALSRLEQCVNEIPVIVLTGRNDDRLVTDALHHGAENYLLKGTVDHESLMRS